MALSCGPQDGVVGAIDLGSAGTDAGTGALVFESEFAANLGAFETFAALDDGSSEVGRADPSARDGWLARLLFPGDETADAASNVGPNYVTQISTVERFGFGSYRTRVRFGNCSANEEVVSAVLGYFNDGTDGDGDSITDNIEIDVQVLCGTPEYLYLTVYTDYEADAGGERFQKLSRVVDFSTGDIFDTSSVDSYDFASSGNRPELVHPDFPQANAFYELGYEWHTGSLRFFIVLSGEEVTLWTLDDPDRVPQRPVHFMYNLWHPESHWYPADGSADFPAQDVSLEVDWLEIRAE